MSSSACIDSKKKKLVLGIGPTQGLGHTLTAAKMYSINFTVTNIKFCLSLHYNGTNSYLFVNGTEIYKFKAKDSEIASSLLCLRNISKDWSIDNMKKTGFNGYVYDFSADYDATDVDEIKDIHKYLVKKIIWSDKYVHACLKGNSCKVTYKDGLYLLRKCFILDHYFYQVQQVQPL